MKKIITIILTIVALLPIGSVSADWAHSFVVYSGDSYKISEDELIPTNDIDKRIGHVTKYSDEEGTYRGNFSNTYPKGTPYYSIKDTDPQDVIAIKTGEDTYVKAYNIGHYANDHLESRTIWISFLLGSIIITFLISWTVKRKKAAGAR